MAPNQAINICKGGISCSCRPSIYCKAHVPNFNKYEYSLLMEDHQFIVLLNAPGTIAFLLLSEPCGRKFLLFNIYPYCPIFL